MVAVLSVGYAYANDSEKMIFDDVTFGKNYEIKGYARVVFQEFSFIDSINVINVQKMRSRSELDEAIDAITGRQNNARGIIRSGNERDIACLRADVLNLGKKDTKLLGTISVKVIYNDYYEYDGFVGQFDYDISKNEIVEYEFAIGPMYAGHFAFFCILPNSVVENDDSPLRMEITIGGHKLTYNIR